MYLREIKNGSSDKCLRTTRVICIRKLPNSQWKQLLIILLAISIQSFFFFFFFLVWFHFIQIFELWKNVDLEDCKIDCCGPPGWDAVPG